MLLLFSDLKTRYFSTSAVGKVTIFRLMTLIIFFKTLNHNNSVWVRYGTNPGSYWPTVDNHIQNIIIYCEPIKSNKHFEHIFYI